MEMKLLNRKERLILTTIEIIGELGIQGLTTREIAKREDVSEATIFRHFKNKNELMLAVLDYYIQYDSDILQSARLKGLKPIEAICFLLLKFAEYYEGYPEITTITQIYDVLRYDTELKEKIKEIQKNRNNILQQLIKEAQIAGDIPADQDSEVFAEMISGFFREICFNWRLENYHYSLRERINTALYIFLMPYQK